MKMGKLWKNDILNKHLSVTILTYHAFLANIMGFTCIIPRVRKNRTNLG